MPAVSPLITDPVQYQRRYLAVRIARARPSATISVRGSTVSQCHTLCIYHILVGVLYLTPHKFADESEQVVYLVDVYLFDANSALAANAFVRSFVAAAFPLFSTYMYQNLGVQWASSLLAFLCLALVPFPIIFYIYGRKIRAASRFAFDL